MRGVHAPDRRPVGDEPEWAAVAARTAARISAPGGLRAEVEKDLLRRAFTSWRTAVRGGVE